MLNRYLHLAYHNHFWSLVLCEDGILKLNIPYCWCSDDPNKKDTTPAERVRGLEDEDVLQEERVQLCKLWR